MNAFVGWASCVNLSIPDLPNLIFPAKPNAKSKTIKEKMHFNNSLNGFFAVTIDSNNIPIIFAIIPPLLNIKTKGIRQSMHAIIN